MHDKLKNSGRHTPDTAPDQDREQSMMPEAEQYLPQQQSTNFFYSFSFLPRAEREAMHTVYAFCRYTDDIVDAEPADYEPINVQKKRENLAWWRKEVDRCYDGQSQHPILRPLSSVVRRFAIPRQYLHILIDGCERDLVQARYDTFNDLKDYCYGVASIVGLMCIEIFGYKYDETKEYAVNLGYALQLTNILRDIRQDAERGRIYIPREDMARFGYSEQELLDRVYDERFVELMRFETRRAREFYHRARAALRPDEKKTMFAAEIMDAIYYRLLEKIEMRNFDVFSKRISVSTPHKVLIAARLWLKMRVLFREKSR